MYPAMHFYFFEVDYDYRIMELMTQEFDSSFLMGELCFQVTTTTLIDL